MGRISYRPNKNQGNKGNKANKHNGDKHLNEDYNAEKEVALTEAINEADNYQEDIAFQSEVEEMADRNNEEINKEESVFMEYDEITETEQDIKLINMREVPNKSRQDKKKLDNVKMIGDMDCEYHIYMEDYVYTYIYQYAYADLSKESAAILIGEVYLDSKEAMITGMIPVDASKITDGSEWINLDVVNEIEEKRKQYFPDQDIIGWLHMQPGYGTMLTMKELREHRSVFEGRGSVFMLVDALNKVESVYVYEDEELKEQSGYCMYYEPNDPMQKYMVEHPFAKKETEEIKDTVVNQFREINKLRKEEYIQRKNTGFVVMAAAVILVALAGIIVRMNDDASLQGGRATEVMSNAVNSTSSSDLNGLNVLVQPNGALGEEVGQIAEGSADEVVVPDLVAAEANTQANTEEGTKETIAEENIEGDEVDINFESETEQANQSEENTTQKNNDTKENEIQETEVAQEYDIYVVKQGDTLANISYDKYGDAKKSLEIAKINGLDSTNNIYVGQELKMPK